MEGLDPPRLRMFPPPHNGSTLTGRRRADRLSTYQNARRGAGRVGRITRRGPSLLRGMLIEVAWVVWRKNPWAQVFVRKVSRGMKSRKKIAIVALARRLLVKLWAMLRTNTPWHEFGPPRAQAVT